MSIKQTIACLQTLHKTIPGVKLAPVAYPGQLNTADLPYVLVWPGRGTTTAVTSRGAVQRTQRAYSVRVFMEAVGQDIVDIPAQAGIDMLNLFIETYMDNLSLADDYIRIAQIDDSGLTVGADLVGSSVLTYAGQFYRGFVCDLTIIEVCK